MELEGGGDRAPERNFGNLGLFAASHIHTADYALAECRLAAADSSFPFVVNGGHRWFASGRDQTLYTHAQEPNGQIPDALHMVPHPPGGIVTARSMHPQGLNVAMGDGSVRFVMETISRNAWRAIGTRDGREVAE